MTFGKFLKLNIARVNIFLSSLPIARRRTIAGNLPYEIFTSRTNRSPTNDASDASRGI